MSKAKDSGKWPTEPNWPIIVYEYDLDDSAPETSGRRSKKSGPKRKHWAPHVLPNFDSLGRFSYQKFGWRIRVQKLDSYRQITEEGPWHLQEDSQAMSRTVSRLIISSWHNHLAKGITKEPITLDEEARIFALHKEHGNKWALIASKLDGRTDNGVKN